MPPSVRDANPREEYIQKLNNLRSGFAAAQSELGSWLLSQGLESAAKKAFERSARCGGMGSGEPGAFDKTADPAAAHAARTVRILAATAREYASIGRFCLENGLLYEARRCAAKSLELDPRCGDGRALAGNARLKGKFLLRGRPPSAGAVWKSGRWADGPAFAAAAGRSSAEAAAALSKKHGMEFKPDFLPCVDVAHTLDPGRFAPLKDRLGSFLDLVRGPLFLEDPKKSILLVYLRDQSEMARIGRPEVVFGGYDWGKGRLNAHECPMGVGLLFHETTHALMEACFERFPPLWMNEGIACFFETARVEEAGNPFGAVNWRDLMYAAAVRENRARSLKRQMSECAMSIDPEGYAQAKALFSWLWSVGELEAFLVGAQLTNKDEDFPAILEKTIGMDLDAAGAKLAGFASSLQADGVAIPRGTRSDEAADAGVEPFSSEGE